MVKHVLESGLRFGSRDEEGQVYESCLKNGVPSTALQFSDTDKWPWGAWIELIQP